MEKKKSKRVLKQDWKFNPDIHGERTIGRSETIPNETLTIREIYERGVTGMKVSGNIPVYDESDEVTFDSLDKNQYRFLDPFEKEILIKSIKERSDEIQKEIDEKRGIKASNDIKENPSDVENVVEVKSKD